MANENKLSEGEKNWVINSYASHQTYVVAWSEKVFLGLAGLSIATISSDQIPPCYSIILILVLYTVSMLLLGHRTRQWQKFTNGGSKKFKELKLKCACNLEELNFIKSHNISSNVSILAFMTLIFLAYTLIELNLQAKIN